MEMKKRKEILARHTKKIWFAEKEKRWKTHLPDEKNTLLAKSSKEKLEDALIEYYESIQEKPKTFDDMYHHWRKIQDTMVSDNTISKYNTDYKRYFLNSDFSKMQILEITEEDIKVFLCSTVKQQKLCQKACKTLFGYLYNVLKSARMNRIISENPMQFLEAKQFYKYCTEKEKSKETRLVSDEDMRMLYERFHEDYKKNPSYIPTYAVELASLTGMRVGEIAALTWDCITKDYIIINKSEKYDRITKEYFIDRTKNGKDRVFPLTDAIRDLLSRVKKVEMQYGYICEWVFANEEGRIHAPVISSCSKNKCRQIGITEKGIHAYRRTVNSQMRCEGVSSTVAASLLGHTEAVNERYYTFDVTNIKEKADIVTQVNKKMVTL